MRPRIALAALFVMLTVGGGACGDDGPSQATVDRETTFCVNIVTLDNAARASGASPSPGLFDGPPEAIAAMLEQLGPVADSLATNSPGSVQDDMATVIGALRAASEGDLTLRDSPAFTEATNGVAQYRTEDCLPEGDVSGEG